MFYQQDKATRTAIREKMASVVREAVSIGESKNMLAYMLDEDTYIRKEVYLSLGKIARGGEKKKVLRLIETYQFHDDFKVRQTIVQAAGEIGKKDFESIAFVLEEALKDAHHAVRNAVIGALKKMVEKNPVPVLAWCKPYLTHTEAEIRREICHGIELRGRTHPQDILPLLYSLQWDKKSRVSKTLIHVLGQIAYKKNCLETVLDHLLKWENQNLVYLALEEIIDVHNRYKDFAHYSREQAIEIIQNALGLAGSLPLATTQRTSD